MAHSYPADLAEVVLRNWHDSSSLTDQYCEAALEHDGLPAPNLLVGILSTCYQASLLREEERPIRFRLIVANAASFPAPGGPPHGLHRLLFEQARPFSHHELRRLAPAVDFHRALIGAQIERDGLMLWGLITTGPRWVQAVYGGRQSFQRLPANLVIRVTGPGRVAACKGLVTVATLVGGRIVQPSLGIFDSTWLPATFAEWRDELLALHGEARRRATMPWAELDPDLMRLVVQHAVRSVVGLIRNSHHGGTILFLPPKGDGSLQKLAGRVLPKYGFVSEEPRGRFRTLLVELMNALAGAPPTHPEQRKIGWKHYASSTDGDVAGIDEAFFELAHQAAGLAAVDGAVVLDKRFELLGFGAEIGGDLPAVRWVARALDAEGTAKVRESIDSDGTRHRSVYRLCNFVHDALAIVASQDGSVRFVKWHEGEVTYWDHVSASVLDA
jgi:hypothetical protein